MRKNKVLYLFILTTAILLFNSSNVFAETITDGDYQIEIEKVLFEVYDEEGLFFFDEDFLEMYGGTPIYSHELTNYNINPTYEDDTWNLFDKNTPARLLKLNLTYDEDLEELFNDNINDKTKDYISIVKIEYKLEEMPSSYKRVFGINFYEMFINSFASMFTGTQYEIKATDLTETLTQPLNFLIYSSKEDSLSFIDDVDVFAEEESLGIILNFHILTPSTDNLYSTSENEQIYYIHDLKNTDKLNTYYDDMMESLENSENMEFELPTITFSDITKTSVKIIINSKESGLSDTQMCELYRSTQEDDDFVLLKTEKCNELTNYVDDKLEAETTYYYKLKLTDTHIYSDVEKITTLTNDVEKKEKVPQTGVSNPTILFGILGISAGGVLLYLSKKNKFYRL